MIHEVLATIKEHNMINKGDKIIVAVSGGPDSICLLHILSKMKEELNLILYAAHVNHCLRGEEADKDEEYVKQFCKSLGVECFSRRVDINKLSGERNMSTESVAREARYDFFDELYNSLGAQKIALAHNANDQAETVLMRIIRGTGMEGIIGIKAVRENIFIRPLINIKRESIEKYCEDNILLPRIDKTNLESIYTRNKIRLELIPYIKENFNGDIISTLNRLADTIARDNEYLENITKEKYKSYCERKGEKVIINKEAFKEHEAIITRIIRQALGELRGNLYNVEKVHIYDLINLQKSGTGKKINLPNNVVGYNNYENIELSITKTNVNNEGEREYTLNINEENNLEAFDLKVFTKVISTNGKINFKEDKHIKYFDFDKVKGSITVRTRKNGDRFTPFGMKGSKKLKDFFMDLKIPQEERDGIPLICFGEDIAWIVGYRISDSYKIDKTTKSILKVSIENTRED
ncbi:tRNA lysidine(34) synthetase TilS [Clostridium swellfunianum]|uniref:tRNA lysidine(34) synthetase TilS n=1 Tax=Clostridium swellfunianum TaxID=1367462 RepID=UPI00202EDEB7|nr:tRNA lysidine(34) synthetase TilS [Clostridium swellfunianum]MCM0647674.1 tRNA lysidine(34) synthetase TilS [Clostridium swellfunianum]